MSTWSYLCSHVVIVSCNELSAESGPPTLVSTSAASSSSCCRSWHTFSKLKKHIQYDRKTAKPDITRILHFNQKERTLGSHGVFGITNKDTQPGNIVQEGLMKI